MNDARGGPSSFKFHAFLGQFGKIVCWRMRVGTPPQGNPRFATADILVNPYFLKTGEKITNENPINK